MITVATRVILPKGDTAKELGWETHWRIGQRMQEESWMITIAGGFPTAQPGELLQL